MGIRREEVKHINKLSINTNTVAHIKEDTRPIGNVHNDAVTKEDMKGSHNFLLRDGTIVDSLPPEEEKKLKQRMRESYYPTFYQLVPKQKLVNKEDKAG